MIKAKPEIVPFEVGDFIALTQDLSDVYEVLKVEVQPFGTLLKLKDQTSREIWDWSTYYINIGAK